MNNKGFINNFFLPELFSIVKKSMASMYILLFLLLVSLISVGVGWGSYIEINNKMEDPFIKFMDIRIPETIKPKEKDRYTELLRKDAAHFKYSNPEALREDNHAFVGFAKQEDDKMLKVMSIDRDNKFFEELKKARVTSEEITFADDEWGCIITESGLKALGLNMNSSHIFWQIEISDNKQYIPLPISGVVTSLRGGNDILVSKKLFHSFKFAPEFNTAIDTDSTSLLYSINSKTGFKSHPQYQKLKELGFNRLESRQESKIKSHTSNFYISIEYLSTKERDSIQSILNEMDIEKIKILDLEKVFQNNTQIENQIKDEKVAIWTIMFDDLEMVEGFVDNVSENYKGDNDIRSRIPIDHSVVQTKKQFEFFRILVIMLAGALCIFSFISIVFFILNLMLSHIKNNKKNLGTLKAFGFSNKNIILTYSCITCCVVLVAFVISYFLSELLGPSVLELVSNFTKNELITEVKYQNLDIYYLVFGLVVLPSLFITWRVYSFLNKVTPGDLIYERR